MANVEEATWHEQAHVRGIALEYALMMFRADRLTRDDYLAEAGRYWQFLADGTVMPSELTVPDDLSDYLPEPVDIHFPPEVIGDTGLGMGRAIPLPPEPTE